MNKNLVLVYENGAKWAIPVHNIADDRAKYYAEKDKHTTYQEEYDFVMEDNFEAEDWFFNNMNWGDVASVAFQVKEPDKFDPSDYSNIVDKYLAEK